MFMTWGVLAVIGLGLLLTYIIWQETRSHLHWRALVEQGNVWAVHELVCAEIERWHHMRPPRGISLALWSGVQTVELVATGRDYVQVACGTEGEYRMIGTRREQVVTPLQAAMRLAAKLIEMLMYDIPEVKLALVRVDVYSTFPTPGGATEQGCLLSVTATRAQANAVDWDEATGEEALKDFNACYGLDERGAAARIDPGPPLENAPLAEAMPLEARGRRKRGGPLTDD
jgi:hypothetical protein